MKEGNLRVSIAKVRPNPWNPNEMDRVSYEKLKRGIKKLLEDTGSIPPIVVRPVAKERVYEIIDGFHRWKVLKELGEDRILVTSLKVNDAVARLLTTNLNYLRGTPDREKYASNLVKMIEGGLQYGDLVELLPESPEDLEQLLGEAEISLEAMDALQQEAENAEDHMEGMRGTGDDNVWVELKFRVSIPQAQVVERELARIGEALRGKHVRARALEYMAVMSSQNELPGEED